MTLVLRLVSFGCTQWTLRVLDPSTLGRASIQLELLLSTVVFLSREGFRLALTRHIDRDNLSVAWLSVPMSALVSFSALLWHLRTNAENDYRQAGVLYCLACFIEGSAEPAIIVSLRNMQLTTKASAEALATVAKTVVGVFALHHWRDDWPISAFGWAQLAYAVVYFIYAYSRSSVPVPKLPLDMPSCYLVIVFTLQGFFKHLLTEGDKIALTMLSGSYDQGVYAMGAAYGGMAARILLQPVEESARLLWSRQALDDSSNKSPKIERVMALEQSYTVLTKLVLYLGFLFSFVAVNYTYILLNLLAGRRWGGNETASGVLSAFCVYTAFLAANGITEAFVYAVASSATDLGRLGAAHTVVGTLFAGLAPLAVARYGTVGLVAANCLAMGCRTIYSVVFAGRYFAKLRHEPLSKVLSQLLRSMAPRGVVMAAFALSYLVTKTSQAIMYQRLTEAKHEVGSRAWLILASQHVAVGGACVFGLSILGYMVEGNFRRSVTAIWSGKQD